MELLNCVSTFEGHVIESLDYEDNILSVTYHLKEQEDAIAKSEETMHNCTAYDFDENICIRQDAMGDSIPCKLEQSFEEMLNSDNWKGAVLRDAMRLIYEQCNEYDNLSMVEFVQIYVDNL